MRALLVSVLLALGACAEPIDEVDCMFTEGEDVYVDAYDAGVENCDNDVAYAGDWAGEQVVGRDQTCWVESYREGWLDAGCGVVWD